LGGFGYRSDLALQSHNFTDEYWSQGDRPLANPFRKRHSVKRIAGIVTLSALAVWGCSGVAQARMNEDECAEHVAQECGPIAFVKCFDDPGMWDRINPDCTAYVQTNLENAREADE
jgi:hypothetical protein